jgi:hypothetical protein
LNHNPWRAVANQWILYPGTLDLASATSFTIAVGERRAVGDFTIPAGFEIVYISGVVRDQAGRPVRRATVALTDGAAPRAAMLNSRASTDAEGRFRLAAHVGQHYGITVTFDVAPRQPPRTAAVPPFEAARDLPPIEITLAD